MQQSNRERLRALIEDRCLLANTDITLSAGTQSSFYFDCKAATLDGEGLSLIIDAVLEEVEQLPERPVAIGGLTIGADPIVAGVIAEAYRRGHFLVHGSIVRKEPKKHGTRNKIENQQPAGTKIVVIDDVITSGNSIRKACGELLEAGYQLVGIIAIIDRQAGGKEALEKDYHCPVRTLYRRDDFPALREGPDAGTRSTVA